MVECPATFQHVQAESLTHADLDLFGLRPEADPKEIRWQNLVSSLPRSEDRRLPYRTAAPAKFPSSISVRRKSFCNHYDLFMHFRVAFYSMLSPLSCPTERALDVVVRPCCR